MQNVAGIRQAAMTEPEVTALQRAELKYNWNIMCYNFREMACSCFYWGNEPIEAKIWWSHSYWFVKTLVLLNVYKLIGSTVQLRFRVFSLYFFQNIFSSFFICFFLISVYLHQNLAVLVGSMRTPFNPWPGNVCFTFTFLTSTRNIMLICQAYAI